MFKLLKIDNYIFLYTIVFIKVGRSFVWLIFRVLIYPKALLWNKRIVLALIILDQCFGIWHNNAKTFWYMRKNAMTRVIAEIVTW